MERTRDANMLGKSDENVRVEVLCSEPFEVLEAQSVLGLDFQSARENWLDRRNRCAWASAVDVTTTCGLVGPQGVEALDRRGLSRKDKHTA